MGALTIQLLFEQDTNVQPGAILQCDTSGEFISNRFDDWRDAVHFILWCTANEFNPRQHKIYNKWMEIYGYDEDEEGKLHFNGDYNEFIKCNSDYYVYTSIGIIPENFDLKSANAWTLKL